MASIDRRPSPTNLQPETNPFRRAASPIPQQQQLSPTRTSPPLSATLDRPLSRNPFLDPPRLDAAVPPGPKSPQDVAAAKLADDIFRNQSGPRRPSANGPRLDSPRGRSSGHRSSRSGDARTGPSFPRPRPDGPPSGRQGPASPERPRQRRNSDSSLMDKDKIEDEKRRRERRREREARREKEGKDGKTSSSKTRTKKPQGLDLIDKLDLTGIYGQGMIHHDGPFDACNPHRNRRANTRAPMQAFHPNSANNTLGGGGPVKFDHDRFHGRHEESFTDYNSRGQDYTTDPIRPGKHLQDKVATYINPTDRGERLHGQESHGLGTSTFLEGAPAPRSAVQRQEAENENPEYPASTSNTGAGLSRKKSLAMRIRGMSASRRDPPPITGTNGRTITPDSMGPRSPETPPLITQSAGGPSRARGIGQERNPFFENSHDVAFEKKGARIEAAALATTPGVQGSPRGASASNASGMPGFGATLTRAVTSDGPPPSVGSYDKSGSSGGFMNRMKSLKGGRRPRPEIKG